MAREPKPIFMGGHPWAPDADLADDIRRARRRRDRWTGAITVILLIGLITSALKYLPSPTPETCQPSGTLTKVTL